MLSKLQDWLLRVWAWVCMEIGPARRICLYCDSPATQRVQISIAAISREFDIWTCDKHINAWTEDL